MPAFSAFSARALQQAADPLAAGRPDGSARPPSPVRAILGPGTGPLAAPNGEGQDAVDDGMSSVGQDEIEARQRFLDAASAEWLAALPLGIYTEAGEEMYSDHTIRPAAIPPVRGPSPQHFNIATEDEVEGGPAESSGTRKRASERVRTGRSTSPRREIADDDLMPALRDGSASTADEHEGPRTPVRTVVKRLDTSVIQAALKRSGPRLSRSVSPAPAAKSAAGSGPLGGEAQDLEHTLHKKVISDAPTETVANASDTHPGEASSSSNRQIPLLKDTLKRSPAPSRATTPRSPRRDEAASLAVLAAETRALEAEARASASESRSAAAEAHALATSAHAETLVRAAAHQAELSASLLNAADLARQAAVGSAMILEPAWHGSPSTATFGDPLIAMADPAPVAQDAVLTERLARVEAMMAEMAHDAQENEAARQMEAAEYERVIRRQRDSAMAAQSITDSLVEKVQEQHVALLAGAQANVEAPEAPVEPHPEFMRDYQSQTIALQRAQQSVDHLTLLLRRSQEATQALIAAVPKGRPLDDDPASWPAAPIGQSRPDPPSIPLRAVGAGERWVYAPPPVKAV